jgi:prophage regulatory protein
VDGHDNEFLLLRRPFLFSALEIKTMERYLRLAQVLEIVPVCPATIWNWSRDGLFPKPIKLGAKVTAWKESEVLAHLENQRGAA